MKFTIQIDQANQIGKDMAVEGYTLANVRQWFLANGINVLGLTAQRILNAYHQQVSKG